MVDAMLENFKVRTNLARIVGLQQGMLKSLIETFPQELKDENKTFFSFVDRNMKFCDFMWNNKEKYESFEEMEKDFNELTKTW